MLTELHEQKLSFHQWAKQRAVIHKRTLLAQPLAPAVEKLLNDMAEESLTLQADEERQEQAPFADYLKSYYEQYQRCCNESKVA